jgi:thiamine pyrophosphate-dependent acetolactate synthase large subunit-like protein
MMGMTGFWGTKSMNGMTAKADVALAVALRFTEAGSSSWYDGVTFDVSARRSRATRRDSSRRPVPYPKTRDSR